MSTYDNILQEIKKILEEDILIDGKSELENIGLNSITFISLVVAMEEMYGVEFQDDDLDMQKYKNVKEFSEYIDTLLHNG